MRVFVREREERGRGVEGERGRKEREGGRDCAFEVPV